MNFRRPFTILVGETNQIRFSQRPKKRSYTNISPVFSAFFEEIKVKLGSILSVKFSFFVCFLAVSKIIEFIKSIINKLIVNVFKFYFTIVSKCFHYELFVT